MPRKRNASTDTVMVENPLQLGGIRTGSLDYPNPMGGRSCRVAFIDTGSGLRFTVALDRGGDIVEAFFNQHSLAYLTPNDYVPPSHAYHRDREWLASWPGGLVTTCGPRYCGGPREEDGVAVSQHGHHSNTPAAVEMVLNPDPARGKREMLLSMVIRDARMFGPHFEVRRQIQCALGAPEIVLHDHVINRGNTRVAHNWLYHVNVGWPLLAPGSRFIYAGGLDASWNLPDKLTAKAIDRLKTATPPLPDHVGPGERGVIVQTRSDRDGRSHCGVINRVLGLGLELEYDTAMLPRMANWQHFGPGGSYVAGIEPFYGSLMGKARDANPLAPQWLDPGQSRHYRMILRVHHTRQSLAAFAKLDGPVTV
jgi:hypothetical protein